jgi:hypothetical protein
MMEKFIDYAGYRLRIMPTAFTRVQTRSSQEPVEVVYADVVVLRLRGDNIDLGNVAIFPRRVIDQIKNAWVGRPIVGTLVRHPGRMPRFGHTVETLALEDVVVV